MGEITKTEPDVRFTELGNFTSMSFNKASCDRIREMSEEEFQKAKRDYPHMAFMLNHIRERNNG